MLLIILFGLILAVGIGFCVCDKCKWCRTDLFALFGLMLSVVGCVATILLILSAVVIQSNKDTEYIKQKETYTTLVTSINELESNDGTAIKGYRDLYNDIVEYNNEVRNAKKWSDNLWTNCFNNDKIAELPLIEIKCNDKI